MANRCLGQVDRRSREGRSPRQHGNASMCLYQSLLSKDSMMAWAPSLHVSKPLAYIVLSPRCCVLENASNEAVKKRCGNRRRTFLAFIIAQLIDLNSMQPLMYFSGVSHHCILAQALRHWSESQHVLNAFYIYLQAKIGKEEILKLTIQYIRRQKGKYSFYDWLWTDNQ